MAVLLGISHVSGFAQTSKPNQSTLTIERIMQDPAKSVGTLPEDIRWDEAGKTIYFNWNPENDTLSSLYGYTLSSRKTEKVPLLKKNALPSENGSYNRKRTQKVYIRNGKLFLLV